MTLVMLLAVGLLSFGAIMLHSLPVAIGLIGLLFVVYVRCEAKAVTLIMHRLLTHGSIVLSKPDGWFIKFWLWWVRSGGVKFAEWVRNHAWHHAFTDTDEDCYTPRATNKHTGQGPLKPLRLRTFWQNGWCYRTFSAWLASDEGQARWRKLLLRNLAVRAAEERLQQIKHLEHTYHRSARARVIDFTIFAEASLSLVPFVRLWAIVLVPALAGALLGLKFVVYLCGGHIINYYGHQAESQEHQSNVPWRWMLLSFFVYGEGWHKLHHDAPWSARFHSWLDPGWWGICVYMRLGFIKEAYVAEPIPDQPRKYQKVRLAQAA